MSTLLQSGSPTYSKCLATQTGMFSNSVLVVWQVCVWGGGFLNCIVTTDETWIHHFNQTMKMQSSAWKIQNISTSECPKVLQERNVYLFHGLPKNDSSPSSQMAKLLAQSITPNTPKYATFLQNINVLPHACNKLNFQEVQLFVLLQIIWNMASTLQFWLWFFRFLVASRPWPWMCSIMTMH